MISKLKKVIETLQKVNVIEKKLHLMNNELRLLIPDIIPIDENTNKRIVEFEGKYLNKTKVNVSISKNDLMFRYACYHIGDFGEAYYGYLCTGLNPKNIIESLCCSVFGSIEKVDSILDFASGYGRVTRFLTAFYGADKIWASEIKPKALDFINQQFGCQTIQSSFVPEEFVPNRKFDVIYVGSLFSHLPEDLFKRWLNVLYNILSEKGILILSTHDISLIKRGGNNSYVFIEDSEDQMFSEVDDFIEDSGKYGAAYIGVNKINKMFKECNIPEGNYHRFYKILSNVQDVYVISKSKLLMNPLPQITTFP